METELHRAAKANDADRVAALIAAGAKVDARDKAQRTPLLAATLLTVYGVWQREGEVRHLIAQRLVDHSTLLQGLVSKSRNFH